MQDYVNFSEKFVKLNKEIFPSIRGKTAYTIFKTGALLRILIKKELVFYAQLVSKKLMAIKDMSLALLIRDTEREGVPPIKSREEFIKYVNQYREYHKLQSIDEWMTILWFHKKDKYKFGLGAFF